MITAKNIRKNYGDLEVLKGINLTINKGEIVSIIGASGAGKTTLLQILGTLDKMTPHQTSSLAINDVKVERLSEKQLAKFRNDHIGFIFQFHQLLPEFTAMENVCIPALIQNKNKAEAEKRAKEFYQTDSGCPLTWEPSGYDFLSPCLEEIDLMRKVLTKEEFMTWFNSFLPELNEHSFTMETGVVGDRTDGHLVHLDGVNFSRAWCLFGLANQYSEFSHLNKLANTHFNYSYPNLIELKRLQ